MSRRLTPLHADVMDDLPDRCRRCVFWELGADRPEEMPGGTQEDAPVDAPSTPARGRVSATAASERVRKQAWVTSIQLETGPPGVIVRDGRETVAHASFAPASSYAPRRGLLPAPGHDALLLATIWIRPDARGHGIGQQIITAAMRDAIRLDLRAVEAYGDRAGEDDGCMLPLSWLEEHGFEIQAAHPRYPLLRLDVRRAARWAESLGHAMDLVRGGTRRPATAQVPVIGATVNE